MPEETMNELTYSIDEEKKLLLGQRTVVESFDVHEAQKQLDDLKRAIGMIDKQRKAFEEEIDKINKFKSYIDKWSKSFKEEQQAEIKKFEKEMSSKKKKK